MILLVSASPRALECAQFLEQAIQRTTVLCGSVSVACSLSRSGEFRIIVFDQATVTAGPSDSATVSRNGENLLAVYVNSALMSTHRIANEVRAAVARLEYERRLAIREANALVCNEVKNEITGVLLAAGLALSSPGLTVFAAAKLRDIQRLASRMRTRLESSSRSKASL